MASFHMLVAIVCFGALGAHGVEDTAQGKCEEHGVDGGDVQSALQVGVKKAPQEFVEGEGNANIEDLDDPDAYWDETAPEGDLDNIMPLSEAQELDQLVAGKEQFDSLPPAAPLLYPNLVEEHDSNILDKLEGLTRDSQIILPGGTTIPYWQTLQYANRNMRIFLTRFVEGVVYKKRVFDVIPTSERATMWETSSLLRKILISDCVKDYIENDPKYPDTLQFSRKKHWSGEAFSGSIFYKHVEEDRRGSYMSLGEMKSACAYATGAGITFNNVRTFSEKNQRQFVGCYAHEQSHNMGYHHKDRAPGGIQNAVTTCYGKKAYDYTTHDLAETPGFEVN